MVELDNPFTPAAVSKPLEMIGSPTYVLACQEPTASDSDINETAGSPGHLSMWKNRCLHAAVCLLRAGQPKRAGDAAKLGEFLGELFWVEFDPMGERGLTDHWKRFEPYLYSKKSAINYTREISIV